MIDPKKGLNSIAKAGKKEGYKFNKKELGAALDEMNDAKAFSDVELDAAALQTLMGQGGEQPEKILQVECYLRSLGGFLLALLAAYFLNSHLSEVCSIELVIELLLNEEQLKCLLESASAARLSLHLLTFRSSIHLQSICSLSLASLL